MSRRWPEGVLAFISRCSKQKPTPVSLRQMLSLANSSAPDKLHTSAAFLISEVPIRIAKLLKDLEKLPCGLPETLSVMALRDLYIQTCKDFSELKPPRDLDQGHAFVESLRRMRQRHSWSTISIAHGIRDLKNEASWKEGSNREELRVALDRFYSSRIGFLLLIDQHLALYEGSKEGFAGLIEHQCCPVHIAHSVVEEFRSSFAEKGIKIPTTLITGPTSLTFTYIPTHLGDILRELLKNSIRAVLEFHHQNPSTYYEEEDPPIRIAVHSGTEDICIKISDKGGGIKKDDLSKIWSYTYTTYLESMEGLCAKAEECASEQDDPSASPVETVENVESSTVDLSPKSIDVSKLRKMFYRTVPSSLTGLGFGLPIARVYTRYFGGDLSLISIQGHGTDAYVQLNRLGTSVENFPRD